MSVTDLAFNRRVIWRNLPGIIIDIRWGHNPRALIRIAGGWEHWVAPAELSEVTS